MPRLTKFARAVVLVVAATTMLHCGAAKGPGPTLPSDGPALTPDDELNAQRGLDHLNSIRQRGGLAPVTLSRDMSADAALHARYLALNAGRPEIQGLLGHNEEVSLPGATVRGAVAGAHSVIAFNSVQSSEAIDEWLTTLYHRIPLLQRELRSIGIGRSGSVHVLFVDLNDRRQAGAPVVFPYADSIAPSQGFVFGEVPDPRPRTWFGTSYASQVTMRNGYPVTATFGSSDTITNVRATLSSGAGPLEVALSSPESPALGFPQGNVVALLPRLTLRPDTTYRAHIDYVRNGSSEVLEWSFRTAPYVTITNDVVEAPAIGTAVDITAVVADARSTNLCDRLDDRSTCQSQGLLQLERAGTAALSVQVEIGELGRAEDATLAIIGHRVRLRGTVVGLRERGFIVNVENWASLTQVPDALPRVVVDEIGAQHIGRVLLVDVSAEAINCNAVGEPAPPGAPLRPPVNFQVGSTLRVDASANVWSLVCQRIRTELTSSKKSKTAQQPRRLTLRGRVDASHGGFAMIVSSPAQVEFASHRP